MFVMITSLKHDSDCAPSGHFVHTSLGTHGHERFWWLRSPGMQRAHCTTSSLHPVRWLQVGKYSEEALEKEREQLAKALERLAGVQKELAVGQHELMAGQKALAEQQDKLVQFLESPFADEGEGAAASPYGVDSEAGPSSPSPLDSPGRR